MGRCCEVALHLYGRDGSDVHDGIGLELLDDLLLRLALVVLKREDRVTATWRQGWWGEEGMPRGAKGGVARRACRVAPRDGNWGGAER